MSLKAIPDYRRPDAVDREFGSRKTKRNRSPVTNPKHLRRHADSYMLALQFQKRWGLTAHVPRPLKGMTHDQIVALATKYK